MSLYWVVTQLQLPFIHKSSFLRPCGSRLWYCEMFDGRDRIQFGLGVLLRLPRYGRCSIVTYVDSWYGNLQYPFISSFGRFHPYFEVRTLYFPILVAHYHLWSQYLVSWLYCFIWDVSSRVRSMGYVLSSYGGPLSPTELIPNGWCYWFFWMSHPWFEVSAMHLYALDSSSSILIGLIVFLCICLTYGGLFGFYLNLHMIVPSVVMEVC